MGVRGVPAQRYYGKAKVFTNIELRTELASFHALGKPLVFGVTGFFDGGRVWADTHSEPSLDGSGVGLKFGTGIGLRLQSGSAFVLRAELAWSPDANPIGGYFVASQAF
jgi:hemolysin activation/secretion protein